VLVSGFLRPDVLLCSRPKFCQSFGQQNTNPMEIQPGQRVNTPARAAKDSVAERTVSAEEGVPKTCVRS